jgi:hypothetical protein
LGEEVDLSVIIFLMVERGARVFKTPKEVKDTYFPNRTLEELEGEPTSERIHRELHQFIEIAKRNTAKDSSKNK